MHVSDLHPYPPTTYTYLGSWVLFMIADVQSKPPLLLLTPTAPSYSRFNFGMTASLKIKKRKDYSQIYPLKAHTCRMIKI